MKPLKLLSAAVLAGATLMSMQVNAHRAWILPDVTVLSGEEPVVAFDAAVSNEIFNFDHFALNVKSVRITAPDGSMVEPENAAKARYRSTFDLTLKQEGTYRVFIASQGLRARWEKSDGKRGSYPGRGEDYTQEGFDKNVPKNAKNLKVSQYSRRLETFVTAGEPSDNANKVTGQGFEMKPVTHPTDLYVGEDATFQFLIDGKPAKGAKVTLIREGSRYRNDQEAIELTTSRQGNIQIDWPAPGRYFLEAEYQDDDAKKPATERTGSYVGVFEVLPD
ncbi:DUF4198 domain-containing protein [Oceanobacter sp. 5_MG-2023]|uniref:DUF4198 domain-containing protein n=1 Tax=Oceanobacter sp. 5_MG-2023 TaxID=3062645 RepID=UPI0026E2618B|nr:DUF4198 domain-containing protein [Oceanobacter sp. 5_MG-2023]MDO6682093.1 DUF4198 domain-containing protein [Oceanobacter sp. 5_MG-2023]